MVKTIKKNLQRVNKYPLPTRILAYFVIIFIGLLVLSHIMFAILIIIWFIYYFPELYDYFILKNGYP